MRFYTTPPNNVNYPYLLVNPKTKKILKRIDFEHAIADSGVLIFHDVNVKDYPRYFKERWKYQAKILTDIYDDRVWCTIPDYPDDYNPGQFGDNVSKTLKNIEDFITVDGVNWVISLQSRFLNLFSFAESIQGVKDLVGDYPRLAIGTVCKTNDLKFITACSELARLNFPNSWIHSFGLTLTALPRTHQYIDSFDSMAWTFPRGRSRGSCKNKEERLEFFNDYLQAIDKIVYDENLFLERGFYG